MEGGGGEQALGWGGNYISIATLSPPERLDAGQR